MVWVDGPRTSLAGRARTGLSILLRLRRALRRLGSLLSGLTRGGWVAVIGAGLEACFPGGVVSGVKNNCGNIWILEKYVVILQRFKGYNDVSSRLLI